MFSAQDQLYLSLCGFHWLRIHGRSHESVFGQLWDSAAYWRTFLKLKKQRRQIIQHVCWHFKLWTLMWRRSFYMRPRFQVIPESAVFTLTLCVFTYSKFNRMQSQSKIMKFKLNNEVQLTANFCWIVLCFYPVGEHSARSVLPFFDKEKKEMVQSNWDMTGKKNARTKENMLIIVIEKAISDPPFNSVSALLSGRLHVCTAKEIFPFPCIPSFFREWKTSWDEMLHHFLTLWMA